MTRVPAHKFHVTPKDSILCDYVLLLNIATSLHVYLNTIILCGVLLLIGCNYCDTSLPHNAMHSSSIRVYYCMYALLKCISA